MQGNDPERARFERWYEAQKDGQLTPWQVWQAARSDAIAQGHACKWALDYGGNLYRRYKESQCLAPRPPIDPREVRLMMMEVGLTAYGEDSGTYSVPATAMVDRIARLIEMARTLGPNVRAERPQTAAPQPE